LYCGESFEIPTNGHWGRWTIVQDAQTLLSEHECEIPGGNKEKTKQDSVKCLLCFKDIGVGDITLQSGAGIHAQCFYKSKWFDDVCWGCGTKVNNCKESFVAYANIIDENTGRDTRWNIVLCSSCFHATRKNFYYDYLASDEWKEKADKVKERAGNRCQVCNSPDNLRAHHRTYERVRNEHDDDLICLCDSCHELFSKNGRLAT
jgi:hypothetical protein